VRVRLRDEPSVYDTPYDHTKWNEHKKRVEWTVEQTLKFIRNTWGDLEISMADLSCGDAAVMCNVVAQHAGMGAIHTTIGDVVHNRDVALDVVGPIEETLDLHAGGPQPLWDLFICTETIEHLADPDVVLRKIRERAKTLVLTTPVDEANDENWEHVWAWGTEDVHQMLNDAGWTAARFSVLPCDNYTYQLWCCR
jgi:2-polyprenyl-3-methyl-5-hydroxy-6-metoxy-1,4-benzoquinol methylase